jgi:4-amino-4-deoxy-L-arabinose transferase-like glycosyltransferase
MLLFFGAIWLLVSFPLTERDRWPLLVAFGALTGMALLTRGQGAVLIPVALLYWLGTSGWRDAGRATAIAMIAAVTIIAPWTARNAVEMKAFIPISTNSAAALRVGHNEDSIGTTKWTEDEIDGFRMWESIYRPEWEVKGYREYTRRAIAYALTHPKEEIEIVRYKIYHLYRTDSDAIAWLTALGGSPMRDEGIQEFLPKLLDYSYYIVLFAGLLSIPLWLRRGRPERWLLVNVVIIWTLFHAAFLGEPRYHIPLFPVLVISIAGGIMALAGRLPAGNER